MTGSEDDQGDSEIISTESDDLDQQVCMLHINSWFHKGWRWACCVEITWEGIQISSPAPAPPQHLLSPVPYGLVKHCLLPNHKISCLQPVDTKVIYPLTAKKTIASGFEEIRTRITA